MAATVEIGSLITRTPGIRGGRPRIVGTGVSVRRIVILYQQGLAPEEITAEIPHLTLAQVYAALAYYHANRDEMDSDIAAEEAEAQRLEEEHFGFRSPHATSRTPPAYTLFGCKKADPTPDWSCAGSSIQSGNKCAAS
jgi:uncharacterized protein (DUF433 family)